MAPAKKKRKTNAVERYLCFSCDEERTSRQFPDYNPASECEHLINTCKTCLKKWVEAQIDSANSTTGGNDGKSFGIKCPQCPVGVMKNADVEVAATKKVYARFVERERKHIAESTPGWRWCLAPGCQAGQVHESAPKVVSTPRKKRGSKNSAPMESTVKEDICQCKECGAKACVSCDRPWHEGESCGAYQIRIKDRVEEEDQALKAIQKVTKPCPGCNSKIEKNGGCAAMTCSQCHTTFCWQCMAAYGHGVCKCRAFADHGGDI